MDWLDKYRENAKKEFSQLALEQSQYTSLSIDFNEIIKSKNTKTEIPPRLKALMDSNRIMIIQMNGEIIKINVPEELKKKGFILEDLNTALKNHESLLREFFEKRSVKPEESKLIAFNCAYFNTGVFVHVPDGMEIKNPVYHIVFTTSSEKIVAQTIVTAGKDSSLNFVEEDYSEAKNVFYSSVTEVHAAAGAKIEYVNIQDFDENVTSFATRRAVVERDALVNWTMGCLGSKLTKTTRDTFLNGEGAVVNDTEIFLGDRNQHFDITSNIHHQVENTKGNVLVKGILKNSARSVSQGMIKVAKNAQKTDSFLAEHTMLLDKNTRSDAIPGLEIEANDVRATHSASVCQIDEEQIFYLKSRGLTESNARKLIALGFLSSAFNRIEAEEIKEDIHKLIEKKWG